MKIPVGIDIIKWSKSDEYTIDDDNVILPPELSESDKKTDEDYEQHFRSEKSGSNAGKGLGYKVKIDQSTKTEKKEQKTSETKQQEDKNEREQR